MGVVFEKELDKLVRGQVFAQNQIKTQADSMRRQLTKIVESLEVMQRTSEERAEQFKAAVETLVKHKDDPEVLVRNYGASRFVYHWAEKPCGRVRNRRYFDRMFLVQALDQGMEPCSACAFHLPSPV